MPKACLKVRLQLIKHFLSNILQNLVLVVLETIFVRIVHIEKIVVQHVTKCLSKCVVIKDTEGIKRIVSELNATGVKTQVTLDNTQHVQIKTIAGAMDRMLSKNQP